MCAFVRANLCLTDKNGILGTSEGQNVMSNSNDFQQIVLLSVSSLKKITTCIDFSGKISGLQFTIEDEQSYKLTPLGQIKGDCYTFQLVSQVQEIQASYSTETHLINGISFKV